ncbi:MAG: phosphoribosylformylglycinamidine synthase subunit PurS [Chloroflexota bacterium]
MYLAKVYVTLKPTVNDPQGLTVRNTLQTLSFSSVRSVRVGKYIEITVDEPTRAKADAHVQEMCRKLLANPVIELFRYEMEELRDGAGKASPKAAQAVRRPAARRPKRTTTAR